ncbi:unnamed protein product [Phaedon cochleariae]|uniref:Double jelly roll-like domain-containing protein n=1 Tax=Phaedon cochleariae TaxID=80249 RepID=A0A9N9X518_PHACE|nr:unnamed protein product [Phaedon cochleariae]
MFQANAKADEANESDANSIPGPPDGGYGWVVVFASFMCNMVVDGVSYCFGIFLDDLAKYYGASQGKVAWNSDEIRIAVNFQDLILDIAESYIYIEGKFIPNDLAKTCHLSNNALAFLFDEIRYEMGGEQVCLIRKPGITTTMKSMISYGETSTKFLDTVGWGLDENKQVILDTPSHTFSGKLPLKFLMGFAEDYNKGILNIKQELILIIARSFKNSYMGEVDANVTINKIEWKIRHVMPSDRQKLKLLNRLNKSSTAKIKLAYRMWDLYELPAIRETASDIWAIKTTSSLERPRYIIIGFQSSDNTDDRSKDATKFIHAGVNNIRLYLNSEVYPYERWNLDFDRKLDAVAYYAYENFQRSYYGKDMGEPMMSIEEFRKNPLFIIDCYHQPDAMKTSTVDIKLEFETRETKFPPNTKRGSGSHIKMAAAKDVLIAELDKFRKSDLIDLIVYQKLPSKVNISGNVLELHRKLERVWSYEQETEESVCSDAGETTDNYCYKKTCTQEKIKVQVLVAKEVLQDKLISELEKRISNLEEIINLIKNCKHLPNEPNTKTKQLQPPMGEGTNTHTSTFGKHNANERNHHKNNEKEDSATNSTKNAISPAITSEQVRDAIKNAQQQSGWHKQSSNRKYKRKPIVGNSKQIDSIKTITKQGYLHVYSLVEETTPGELEQGLKITAPHIPFQCEILNKQNGKCSMYGCRVTCLAGALVSAASFGLSVLCPSVEWLMIVYGVGGGLGFGLMYVPAVVNVGYYFEKRRSLATGIAVCGSGFGTFAFAPLGAYFLNSYGWKGANLVLAGICLSCVIFAILMKPIAYEKKSDEAAVVDAGLQLSSENVTKSLGIDKESASLFISIIGFTNTLGRIVCGFIADLPQVNTLLLNNVCLIVMGLAVAAGPFCHTFTAYTCMSIAYGSAMAGYISLASILLVEYLGLESLTSSFGLLLLFRGTAAFIGSPLAGMLYDSTHSYTASFLVASVFFGAATVTAFCIPLIERRKNKSVDEKSVSDRIQEPDERQKPSQYRESDTSSHKNIHHKKQTNTAGVHWDQRECIQSWRGCKYALKTTDTSGISDKQISYAIHKAETNQMFKYIELGCQNNENESEDRERMTVSRKKNEGNFDILEKEKENFKEVPPKVWLYLTRSLQMSPRRK